MAIMRTITAASKELTAKERIKMKQTADLLKIDELTQVEPLVISVAGWAIVLVTSDDPERDDYNQYVIMDKEGNKYVTGSEICWSAFIDIYSEMVAEQEDYEVKFYKVPSRKYAGKEFLTCTII